MSISQFKYNKRRKHYAYSHKKRGSKEENILITSKPYVKKHKNGKYRIILRNVPLYHHPNSNKEGQFYVIPLIMLMIQPILILKFINGIGIKMISVKLSELKSLKRRNKKKSATIPPFPAVNH